MAVNLKSQVEQYSGVSASAEGLPRDLTSTRLGQLFTADWKTKLLLAGKCYRVTSATFTADADMSLALGGAATIENLETPQICCGVDEGYFLIPMEVDLSVESLADAANDHVHMLVIADRTQTVPTSVTGITEVPVNMLDGAPNFPGMAYSAISVDITDPVMSELLQFRTVYALGTTVCNLTANLHYEPKTPSILKGPCSIYAFWGGTIATLGAATMVVAAVPIAWMEN